MRRRSGSRLDLRYFGRLLSTGRARLVAAKLGTRPMNLLPSPNRSAHCVARPAARAAGILALGALAVFSAAPPLAGTAHAADPVGAVFLRVGVGARAAALGDADIVGSTDASALHWNPAGLALLPRRELLLLHNEWLADVRQEYVGGVFPVGRGGFGVGMDGFYVDHIPRFIEDVPEAEAQGDFGAYDLAVLTGYGRRLAEPVSVGITVKAIAQKIDIESAYSAAVDVGMIYRTPYEGLDAGIVVSNIGPPIDFLGVSAALPLETRAGLGYRRPLGPFRASLYGLFHASRRLNPRAHFGAELTTHGVSLRAGAKTGYDAEDASYGMGYAVGRFGFDYAFVPFSEDLLGEAHRVSVSFSP